MISSGPLSGRNRRWPYRNPEGLRFKKGVYLA